MERYIVMTACAKVPTSWKWQHKRRKVAVVELEEGFEGLPKMISERARGVRQIVRLWDRLHVGSTERSEYYQYLAKAEELAAELNAKEAG